MKIQKTKSKVAASIEIPSESALAATVPCDDRTSAIEFIQSAISALSAFSLENPDDAIVTDSIANLGVVLLDLKSSM